MSTREAYIDALYQTLITSSTFHTTGRRLVLWNLVNEQPALFLRHVGDDNPPRPTRIPPRTVIDCEPWIYAKAPDPDSIPETVLNNLLDDIDRALQPAPASEAQTLGGLVTHCWIEGRIEIHPGDLDGQGIAVVPIKMLVPTIL
jgi:hypothetical protein